MKLEVPLRQTERALWLIAALILIIGYSLITKRYGERITEVSTLAQREYSQTLANRRLLANKGRIEALRVELRRRLARVELRASPSQMTAVLVQDLDRTARAYGCSLISIEPGHRSEKRTAEELPVDISMRGTFSKLLRVMAALPRLHTLLRVGSATFSISVGQQDGSLKPLLDARIHSVMYRLSGATDLGGE